MQANQTGTKTPAYSSASRWAEHGLFLATLVALPLTLAACSTQTSQPSDPLPMPTVNTATTSAAATEPATEDTQATPVPSTGVASETPLLPEQIEPPVPSDAARENSADGAEAYAYFLFQAWWYLINTHDIHWWDTNIPDCEWKEILRGAAVEATDKGAANELAAFVPRTMDRRVNPENPSEFAITLQAEVGPIFEISSTGKRVESAEKRDQELIARLLHNGNNWEAVAIVTREAGEAP